MSKFCRELSDAKIRDCQEQIRSKIAALSGTKEYIETDDGIAFSGSREEPELLLTISTVTIKGQYYLYADLDDEVSWQEWDFSDRTEFENNVAEYIAPLVNHTVKTVVEKKKRQYLKQSRYYLNDQNEWVLIDEEVLATRWLRLFLNKDVTEETMKVYRIEQQKPEQE